MLQFFPPPEEHALKLRVSEVLQRIVTGTDVTKNVNKNNVTHGASRADRSPHQSRRLQT